VILVTSSSHSTVLGPHDAPWAAPDMFAWRSSRLSAGAPGMTSWRSRGRPTRRR
jgi:hypothetical protein